MKSSRAAIAVFVCTVFLAGATLLWAGLVDEDTPEPQSDDLIVDIFGTTGGMPMVRKDPIAVPLFKNEGDGADRDGFAEKLADTVSEDMRMTGRFEVINRAMYVEDPNTAGVKPGEFSFDDWSVIGAEYLIKGAFATQGDTLTAQFRLFHVPTKQMLVGKEYTGPSEDWYVMVHKFGNDVVYALTREKGIFGTKIAFVSSQKDETQDLYIIDVDGRNQKRLTFLGGKVRNPTWSPDGSQIVFAYENSRNPADKFSYLYTIPAAGGEPTLFMRVPGVAITPRFSPSGSRLALAIMYEDNMEIYTVGAKGGTPNRLTVSKAIELFPAWSPRGDRLAFISDRAGGPQVWIMNSDGSAVQRASYHGGYNQSPDWANTPEGERIVYSARESGMFHIISMKPDGTDATVITQGQGFGSCEYPSFSPDGRAIALTTTAWAGGGRIIRLFNTDGSYSKQLTHVGVDDKNPAWSPRLLN